MNLNQVKAKADAIKQARDPAWWAAASLDEMEQARMDLRDILKHRDTGGIARPDPPVIDITDTDEVREEQST
jgi:type I restriction enzyme R subunit